jgi:hypothetical protein
VAGHHTGAPLQLPGLEPVPASGKHFCLAEEVQKVKVQGDKVQEIVVSPGISFLFYQTSSARHARAIAAACQATQLLWSGLEGCLFT